MKTEATTLDAKKHTVTIGPRYCGPPGVGQGGLVCAILAEHCGDPLEVTLRRPAPLGREIEIRAARDGAVELVDRAVVVASARPVSFELAMPRVPDWADAEAAGVRAIQRAHPFPDCFVCGPDRGPGDGLHVLAGPVGPDDGLVATVWRPHPNFLDADGRVAERYLWAALDCPGGMAALAGRDTPIVLGRLTGRLERSLEGGERAMVLGWRIARSGRKHVVGTALIGETHGLCGLAQATWVELDQAPAAAA